jgi:hypothetical protein
MTEHDDPTPAGPVGWLRARAGWLVPAGLLALSAAAAAGDALIAMWAYETNRIKRR